MCGRYAASTHPEDLVEEFEVDDDRTDERTRSVLAAPQDPPVGHPDHNMAPSKQAPVVLTRAPKHPQEGCADPPPARRQLRFLTWGLVPGWVRDPRIGMRMINARAEELLDKRAFTKAALSRRCLVPADGWYEWQASPTATDRRGRPRKQPFFVRRADGRPMAMAGLYEFWRDRALPADHPDAWLVSYSIITTSADPGLDRLHERQPLVLEPEDWAVWLDPSMTDRDTVARLLDFHHVGRFDAWPVGPAVGSVRNNGAELVAPLDRDQLVGVVDPMTGEIIGG
ncbi:MAG TPA: SOS response-associated peptidase [Segeticoccus sp.]|uniref:SOS response-associated peptidase n=1 Tax=Segeticoccus sp. TaxID=2706531 RepID=UPI002D7F11BB|nr:SOS response-associated peptidase [Segeticoccus sp.]HET8602214.1 SOS response-associated peptidase [Segeticoccus sp.]